MNMSSTLETTNGNSERSAERIYGLHEWCDQHGNHGTELLSQHRLKIRAVRANGLFEHGPEKPRISLADYFHAAGDSKRRIFVVVDSCLPEDKRTKIEDYFAWCKMEMVLENYRIMPIAVNTTEKTLPQVIAVATAAKQFSIRRRDLFVAIGSTMVTDIVGFVAAVYRRSTPYISVPTDPVGIVNAYNGNYKVSIHHVKNDGSISRGLFAVSHLPLASFWDPSFLDSLRLGEIKRGLIEVIKIAVVKDDALFWYVEAYMDKMLTGTRGGYLTTAVELAARAASEELRKDPWGKGAHLITANYGHEAARAIEHTKGITYDDTDSIAIGVALMSALSFCKRCLSGLDLGRVLNMLGKATLPICDERIDAKAVWKCMTDLIQERGQDSAFVVPIALGRRGCLDFTDISPEDIGAALNILRKHCPQNLDRSPEMEMTFSTVNVADTSNENYAWTALEDVQYHVALVPEIFNRSNPTIIQNYCLESTDGHKKKVLIVVDDYVGNASTDICDYFQGHNSVIDDFGILSMHVSSTSKDSASVLKVVDAAIGLRMSQRDLFVVVGGGTLMDIVGFAAAIYRGGTRYVRIPTTLLGMIDAGVGVKVGVNVGNHKSFIGRYHAPLACLNDPATFLATLPQREFACGLAEALKMAVVKSPRLFELIARYEGSVKYNTCTDQVIQISIHTMLEELQPNLREQSLRRLVDFAHEFGHIVESAASYEIPHGECVAIGMALSSFLAHLKGILARTDLERILDLILGIGLPIYATNYDCCNPNDLWAKICSDGIEHKDGMLYLVVPEKIGRATFLDKISEINDEMIRESVFGLRRYADWFAGKKSWETDGFNGACLSEDIPSVPNAWTSSTTTAAIIGASGDVGSQLADYLVHNDVPVICSIRSASLQKFRTRVKGTESRMRVLVGDVLDVANLRVIIQNADVLFNMAGVVTLSAKPADFAMVIAVNGFAQGIITYLIQQMGRAKDMKFVYPSTQRVHLTSANTSVNMWVREAAEAFSVRKDVLLSEQDICTALERFAGQFIARHPLPTGFNVYEISKKLGEHFVSLLPRHSLVRISAVYGPAFTRGFIYRALNPKPEGNVEAREKRDFIYIDDVNELLLKAAQTQTTDCDVFDGASGESIDLQDLWLMVRELIGDRAPVVLNDGMTKEEMSPDPTIARRLLGRNLTPIRLGLRKTIEACVQLSHHSGPIIGLQYPETFKPMANEDIVRGTTLIFARSGDRFYIHAGASPITEFLERSLTKWFNKLPISHQKVLTEYVSLMAGLTIHLRADAAMTHLSEFTIQGDDQHGYQGTIDIHAGFATRACKTDSWDKIDDVVGHEGYHLLAFLLRGRKPLLSDRERELEEGMAENWQDYLIRHEKPHVLAVDVGATYLRIGVLGPNGLLLPEPTRILTPSKQLHPEDTLARLQERLVETLIRELDIIRTRYVELPLEELGISFGAVITREGVVQDASILWTDSARGYDFKTALQESLPGMKLTILNDVSAAAWRYKDEGRFCLITVSSGLSNKVFNSNLRVLDKLDLDAAGVGGEMGHVVVEPRAVDALVRHSIEQATVHPEEFRRSQLNTFVQGDIQKINARYLGMAVKEGDVFALRLLEEADVPACLCGNLADLCSYSSGRGALRNAKKLAARGHYHDDIAPNDITDSWLQKAIVTGHPLALKVLDNSTYPLALRILQLAADIGLEKFVIVGGFAMKVGQSAYLHALQDHLVRFCYSSAFFADWPESRICGLVKFGVGDDNDGLIGVGNFVQHLRAQYHAVEKAVGEPSLALVTRSIPRCGARDVLAKVLFSGICTTDLQILRSERGLEPTVLGHEGVCQVVEMGKDVRGLSLGSMIVINPNNPLDEHDKLGHTREGLFQEYIKFSQEFLERKQVLILDGSTANVTDTLIEPLSCVIAAQERIKDRIAGKNVLVSGAGVMGLLFILLNFKYGARNVFLTNRSQGKLDYAVAKGLIQHDKVFAIDKSISSQIDQVSAGEGVDIVIITVSMGEGILAARDAVNYINAGGCVYLFGGFRPGDILPLDGGAKVDLMSIRSGWRTEHIQVAGKSVALSGHRGSGYQDLAMAASFIRGDRLSFSKVISHNISLSVLPETVMALARGKNMLGVPAKRVIVDMNIRDSVVEFAEELPLRHLHEATRKRKDAIFRGNLFREIGFDDNHSMLGWVCPPAWQDIKAALGTVLQMNALTSKSDFIFCGTGGWVFLVDALKEIIPASHDITVHTLQSLDPQALANLFSHVKDISRAVCIGISQSGRTLETVMLMNALREYFDSAGLNYREHFIWLTDMCKSVHDCKSGEAAVRASKEYDWSNVGMMPLTVNNHSDINALFCAPHSLVMFLTLVLLLGKETEAVWHAYQQYLALRQEAVHSILPKADSVALNDSEHIQVILDESIAPAVTRLATQLIAQSLGSKQAEFNPRVRVASQGSHAQSAGFQIVALPMAAETPAVVKVLLTMSALATFVAMVAYHRRITFVTHPKVELYKRRAVELMAASYVEGSVSDIGRISTEIKVYLDNNTQMRFVDIICYGLVPLPYQQSVKNGLASYLTPRVPSILIDVVQGEDWNHSVYQAAIQTKDTLYVILVPQEYCSEVKGISKETICSNVKMLKAIARATYETLGTKALYFIVDDLR